MKPFIVWAFVIVVSAAAPPTWSNGHRSTTPGQRPPTSPPGHPATPSGTGTAAPAHGRKAKLTKQDKEKLLESCQKKGNKCKGQTDEYKKKRENVKAFVVEHLKTHKNLSQDEAVAHAEIRLNKINELKKKIHAKHGLSEIEPADTGLWQNDMVLTDPQIEAIQAALDNPRKVAVSPAEASKQKRSAAMFFEENPNGRWRMPIHYWISGAFSSTEQATIDAALRSINQATGCISFVRDGFRATSGSQVQYVKVGTGCYGNSMVGQVGVQSVNLATTGWCSGQVLRGLVLHETIHALGGGHEQARVDRDDYVDILWSNIDPQEWSQYERDDSSTSYGVPYDYLSVMHYEQGTFAASSGLDTMNPHVSTQLHSDGLTSKDVLQLKRMYCRPSTCLDQYQDCGYWATTGYCKDGQWGSWMGQNCGRSCGTC